MVRAVRAALDHALDEIADLLRGRFLALKARRQASVSITAVCRELFIALVAKKIYAKSVTDATHVRHMFIAFMNPGMTSPHCAANPAHFAPPSRNDFRSSLV